MQNEVSFHVKQNLTEIFKNLVYENHTNGRILEAT